MVVDDAASEGTVGQVALVQKLDGDLKKNTRTTTLCIGQEPRPPAATQVSHRARQFAQSASQASAPQLSRGLEANIQS